MVFGLLTDFGRRPEWLPLREAEQTSPGMVTAGTTFREVNRILWRNTEVRLVVLEAVERRRLTYRSERGGSFVAEVG